jgi:quercetin dioxygenase-like cupin family protein
LKYITLYIDSQNVSHFREDQAAVEMVNFAPPARPVGLTEFMDVSKMVFFQLPSGWFGDWHPAPKRQFFCCLKGQLEITSGDGEVRRFNSGDVFLLEDIHGRGHVTRVIGEGEFVAAVVQLAVKP